MTGRAKTINLWSVLVLSLLCILVWGRTRSYEFVWDDLEFIVLNTSLRHWRSIPEYFTDITTMAAGERGLSFVVFRPLRNISYLIDFKLAGLSPGWWHVHNVLLHLLNTILLFFVGKKIFRNMWFPAFATAVVFLLHPVQTETVAWVKCRDDLLAVFYALLFILYWLVRGKAKYTAWDTCALCLLYLAACLAKVQAVILPGLACILDFYLPTTDQTSPDRDNAASSAWRRVFARWTTLLGLTVCGMLYLLARTAFIGQTAQTGYLAGSFIATMLTMTRAAVRYLTLLFAPLHQQADYMGMPASGKIPGFVEVACIVLLIAICISIFLFRKRFPHASLGTAWVIIALLPVSNIVPTMQYLAERFLYLPMVGFAIFAASGLDDVRKRHHQSAMILFVLIAMTYAFLSVDRVSIWKNNLTLFSQTVLDTPEQALRPRKNKLVALIEYGMYEEAVPLAKTLCARALAEGSGTTSRNQAIYARSLGFAMLMLEQKEEGLRWLAKAKSLDPSYFQPYLDLGVVAGNDNQHDVALHLFMKAVALDPSNPTPHFNLAVGFEKLNRLEEAEQAYRKALRLGSKTPNIHEALAALLWKTGRYRDAADVYRDGLRLWPDSDTMRYWLERAIAKSKNGQSAEK